MNQTGIAALRAARTREIAKQLYRWRIARISWDGWLRRISIATAAAAWHVSTPTAKKWLRELVETGLAELLERGIYRLATSSEAKEIEDQ